MATITELEYMAARHWRGTAEQRLGGWLLRAADGFTGRANSALPLGDPGMPLTCAICAEAAARGARQAFLQVETGNIPARALYERCGFRCSHRYHYRVRP